MISYSLLMIGLVNTDFLSIFGSSTISLTLVGFLLDGYWPSLGVFVSPVSVGP